MSPAKSSKNDAVEAPAIIVQLHKSIQQLPAEARETDPCLKDLEQAVKTIVESESLHPAFAELHKLAPYPHVDADIIHYPPATDKSISPYPAPYPDHHSKPHPKK